MPTALAIHGGAGTILRQAMTSEREQRYRQALSDALDAGQAVLKKNGTALDAVEQAVRVLEDCPLFNAGKGSVFTYDGRHEMDASVMNGKDRSAGAVTCVTGVRNPVTLARTVMEQSGHVLLAGEGAHAFARRMGLPFEPEDYFFDAYRHEQWQQARKEGAVQLDHSDKKFGTVGAVALDAAGNLAAATSTGGLTNKQFGRVGDTPLIGSGTWADNATCAVSCTGHGEYFIRAVAAYDVACLMQYRGMSLAEACRTVVHDKLGPVGGEGGMIAVDASGAVVLDFNSEGMYRGAIVNGGEKRVEIYR
jgi:beta-aspartyl-peptidase (threonine type)